MKENWGVSWTGCAGVALLLLWLLGLPLGAQDDGVASDRAALMALYEATDGENWANNENWGSDAPLGTWHGVSTDEQGRVTELRLGNNHMRGELPPVLGTLDQLRVLILSKNKLSWEIPSSLENLVNLEWLDLVHNDFCGHFPAGLANLPDSTAISVPVGGFDFPDCAAAAAATAKAVEREELYWQTHAILMEFYHATDGDNWINNTNWGSSTYFSNWYGITGTTGHHVRSLDLSQNGLSGNIPPSLSELTLLNNLNLSQNRLTGTIPDSLTTLDLWTLDLSHNELSGAMPVAWGNLDNLQLLNLSDNQLTGRLPIELGAMSKLGWLDLARNNLTGNIPGFLGNPRGLSGFYLSGNQFCGAVPEALTKVRRNDLAGTRFPDCKASQHGGDLAALMALYNATVGENWLSNDLWGTKEPLDSWHGVLTNDQGRVVLLNLPLNRLRGKLPPEIGNLTELVALFLSNNSLEGEIPDTIRNLTKLAILDLKHNSLEGEIPATTGDLTSLLQLALSWNQLSGNIPDSLGRLANLQILLLHKNQLTGNVPESLGNLSQLRNLSLSSNSLSGRLPRSLGALDKLEHLSVAWNRFCGDIPENLVQLVPDYVLERFSDCP
ncbi:MAG: hypothetical protein OXF32_11165 [Anaerolineaceae bacterium]|nr:hypothetical protein [Anaerolineaceae bacterium]